MPSTFLMLAILSLLSSLTLAERTQADSCWAQFRPAPDQKLCIPHSLWIQWLNHPSPPSLRVNQTNGTQSLWKLYSPPENTVHSPKSKKVFHFQTLTALPENQRDFSLSIYLGQKVERVRESLSETWAAHDSLGILRSLVLGEGSSKNTFSMLRVLGWVHLVSATGIHLYAWISFWNSICRFFCHWLGIPVRIGLWISRITGWAGCLTLWLLAGARLSMLRPLIIITARNSARILGFRWSPLSPLILALVFELGLFGIRGSGQWI